MLPSKTVFVVGAGASQEVGLPVGSQLKRIISDKLNIQLEDFNQPVSSGDHVIVNMLRQLFFVVPDANNRHYKACRSIHDGVILSSSIDDFIDAHQDDKDVTLCGKLAIARSILEAERSSKLFYESNNINKTINFNKIDNSWYAGFFQLLSQKVTKENLKSIFENVTVVSFNYDRCIEHFLVHAVAAYYRVDINAAHSLVEENLAIFHPYGSVGPYFGLPDQTVEFGFNGPPNLEKVIKSLKTYTEQVEDNQDLLKIRMAITQADVVVFLGNAFHDNNITILGNPINTQNKPVMKRIYATRKGISDADLSVVKLELAKLCKLSVLDITSNMHFTEECHQLFDEYQKSLRR